MAYSLFYSEIWENRMKYTELGGTGLRVSRLCFGGLIIGPLQADLSVERGAAIIVKAFELGVNFVDTAEIYGTYGHIGRAVKKSGVKPVIATKTYAYTAEGAKKSLEKARKELDIDVIDIFLLHEQESRYTLDGHRKALEYLLDAKAKGLVKAAGFSTHRVEAVDAGARMPEIDVIHPLINKYGVGIEDGTSEQMVAAVECAYRLGKGIYGMKPLGGGNLFNSYSECMEYVLNLECLHSIAVGMQSEEEVIMNVCTFNGEQVPEEITRLLKRKPRKLHIDHWCEGCGRCVERCGHDAIELRGKKAVVIAEKCVLCGYCGSVCPQFAIKIC